MGSSEQKFDIEYITHLARVELTPEEKAKFGAQLGTVLEYMEKLREVDISNVKPTAHPIAIVNVMRADEPRPGLDHKDAMKNAPESANGLFIVPKIVE